jgi:hypothetical protein
MNLKHVFTAAAACTGIMGVGMMSGMVDPLIVTGTTLSTLMGTGFGAMTGAAIGIIGSANKAYPQSKDLVSKFSIAGAAIGTIMGGALGYDAMTTTTDIQPNAKNRTQAIQQKSSTELDFEKDSFEIKQPEKRNFKKEQEDIDLNFGA